VIFLTEDMLSLFIRMPTLETPRLLLRKIVVSDYQDMYDYSRRPETSRYLLWSPHSSPRFTKKYVSYLQGQYRNGNFYDFAVIEKASGKMIGTCGFTDFDLDINSAELGYILHPDYWGKGFGKEAVLRVMSYGFAELRLHRMTAKIMAGNIASKRLAQSCGMRHEATHIDGMRIKGNYETIDVYAILAREFFGKRL
jgi:ribosomal-protein-alanine N-acetyltransferase